MERPIRKEIRIIQRLAVVLSSCSYHLVMAQNTIAVNSEDIAYTSPSTAENQNVSEKQYASAPTAPLPRIAMVRAEHKALIELTRIAACILSPNIVKNLAISWNTGFPGGCPTSNLYDEAMNSPQSQKDAVGSSVER